MRFRTGIPTLVFLAACLIGCLAADTADMVIFSSWRPFMLLVLAPWIWWISVAGHAGLGPVRLQMALLTRLLLLFLFIMLLAEPRTVRRQDDLSVIYVVDASASISPEALSASRKFVVDVVYGKPETDKAALVFFGRNAAVELPPGVSLPLEDFQDINVHVDRDGTDLAQSLSLASALLTEETPGRIVLVSDFVETRGNLARVIDDLTSRAIPVDVLGIDYAYENEVWIERLELPRFVKMAEAYEAGVVLSALKAGRGRLTLRANNEVLFSDEVTYGAGKNRLDIPIYLREPGYYEYMADIEPAEGTDSTPLNNKAISHLYLQGKGMVMLVTDPSGDPRAWQHLAATLRRLERTVKLTSAFEVPRNPLALLPYDCIILVNVPAETLSEPQMVALRDAVRLQGSGLVMVGGKHSFGPGGYQQTPVEEALPVSMDISQNKSLPKGALAIVLHTCEFPEGNTWGKRITKQAIKVLSHRDEVGVLVYDRQGADRWLFPLTPAGEYQRLVTLINNAQIGDMPTFGHTMQMGLQGLIASTASAKHMLIISDGDPSPPTPALLQQFRDHGITVSTVAIEPHGGTSLATMRAIANATGGRFYYPKEPTQLPSIFIKEAKTVRRTGISNETFVPVVAFPSQVLKGIDAIPPLHGHVLTTPKPRAATVLRSPQEENIEPVLATWRYGVGTSAAFTSDLSSNWGADWLQWKQYDAFVKQLLAQVARPNQPQHLRLRSHAAAGEGIIVAEDFAPDARMLTVRAQVIGPRGEAHTLTLEQVGIRRYEVRFPLAGEGRYQVTAAAGTEALIDPFSEETEDHPVDVERAHGGFVLPYSQEYMRFRSNPILANHIAESTRGRALTGSETGKEIYGAPRTARTSSSSIIDLLLLALVCLVPLDVAMRRVHIDLAALRAKLGPEKREKPSAEMFSVLLARKKNVAGTLQSTRPVETVDAPGPHRLDHKVEPKAAKHPAPPTPDAGFDTPSTTQRLLAAKRRVAEDDTEDSTGPRAGH